MAAVKVVWESMPFLLKGTWVTLWISLLTLVIATLAGLLLNTVAILTKPRVGKVIGLLVDIIRGTPLVVEVFLLYHGLPMLGWSMNPYLAAVVALSVFFTAGMYEAIRGGIAAIAKGQTEAYLALGMTRLQGMRRVILPQAVRATLPPWVGEFTGIIKGSSLIALLSLFELTLAGREVVERTYMGLEVWSVVMLIYFLLCYPLSYVSEVLEKRFHYVH